MAKSTVTSVRDSSSAISRNMDVINSDPHFETTVCKQTLSFVTIYKGLSFCSDGTAISRVDFSGLRDALRSVGCKQRYGRRPRPVPRDLGHAFQELHVYGAGFPAADVVSASHLARPRPTRQAGRGRGGRRF
jgi:hypothetical protein